MSSDREYMREYMRRRYHRRRREAIKRLGGACVRCGTRRALQLDHIDPKTKTMTIARMTTVSRERFERELVKCQVLCKKCHEKKTVIEDRRQRLARGTHGTISSYRYCHCDLCRKAKTEKTREYMRKYHKMKRTGSRCSRVGKSTG